MDKYTKLTLWSERIITWIFLPALLGLFGLYFLDMQHLMIIPLAFGTLGVVALFVIYVWRFFVPWP